MQHERQSQFDVRYALVARRAILVFTLLAVVASWVTAQSVSQLNGSISDPSAAIVVGAKITLTDSATGLQRTSTSNGAGLYQFLDVPQAIIGWKQQRPALHIIWYLRCRSL